MKSISIITAALLVAPSFQAPSASKNLTDADILNFALTLEHLEASFYTEGLAKYDKTAFNNAGFSDGVRQNLQKISTDETSHVNFLATALKAAGATPVQPCAYAFPHTDPKSFLAVSQILEGVGVSAYLGAAGSIANPAYLTAAATILTVEARHNAYVRFVNSKSAFPAAFDTPIDPRAVVTLAAPFFKKCPSGSAPSFKPFPELSVAGKLIPGSKLKVTSSKTTGATNCAFVSGLDITFSAFAHGVCDVPSDGKVGAGQVYVLLTSSKEVTDHSTIAGPTIVETESSQPDTARRIWDSEEPAKNTHAASLLSTSNAKEEQSARDAPLLSTGEVLNNGEVNSLLSVLV